MQHLLLRKCPVPNHNLFSMQNLSSASQKLTQLALIVKHNNFHGFPFNNTKQSWIRRCSTFADRI